MATHWRFFFSPMTSILFVANSHHLGTKRAGKGRGLHSYRAVFWKKFDPESSYLGKK